MPEQCAPVQTPVSAALSTLMQDGQVRHPFCAPSPSVAHPHSQSLPALQQQSPSLLSLVVKTALHLAHSPRESAQCLLRPGGYERSDRLVCRGS